MSVLSVSNITKSFGELKAVDRVSFQIGKGEIYGLLGPNGAGKTTTISIISGLIRADDGDVEVDGFSFWKDPVRAKKAMGVVPQEIALYEELSARENLLFWGQLAGLSRRSVRVRADELLETMSLGDRGNDILKTYSGGMKRRINLGCALMHDPKVLLLDEPTVGIDPQARTNILEFVEELAAQGTSILYTTHYLEEAERFCQRIGIVDHGKLLAEGGLDDLQKLTGGKQLYVLEGNLSGVEEVFPADFLEKFKVIQRQEEQITVSPLGEMNPSECLKDILELPVSFTNISVKKPTLNEVFLKLTGRELRE